LQYFAFICCVKKLDFDLDVETTKTELCDMLQKASGGLLLFSGKKVPAAYRFVLSQAAA